MKYVYVDLSQGMRRTQTRATTRSEQTMMVPIEAPPFIGLRINYNIFDRTRRLWYTAVTVRKAVKLG